MYVYIVGNYRQPELLHHGDHVFSIFFQMIFEYKKIMYFPYIFRWFFNLRKIIFQLCEEFWPFSLELQQSHFFHLLSSTLIINWPTTNKRIFQICFQIFHDFFSIYTCIYINKNIISLKARFRFLLLVTPKTLNKGLWSHQYPPPLVYHPI